MSTVISGSVLSNTGSTAESPSLKYKGAESIYHIKEENIESKHDLFPLAVNSEIFEACEGDGYQSFVESNSKNTSVKPGGQELVPATTYISCVRDRKKYTGESIEVEKNIQSAKELEKTSQRPPVGVVVEEKLNAKGENNLCSNSFENESSKERQEMNIKSGRGREIINPLEDSFSNVKIEIVNDSKAKIYGCQLCERKFQFPSKLKRHSLCHTGEKPFTCEICGNKFAVKFRLKIHMTTHSGKKPYRCKICEYEGIDSSNLKVHQRTHTGEKPYRCERCEYEGVNSSALKRHMRRHTGEKPYKCERCEYECTVKSTLMRHMRSHTGEKPYECKVCEYKSTMASHLRRHMRIHKMS